MNHLTNIYKHKCEQLQEQLNNLTRMLNEVGGVPPIRVPKIPHIPNLPDIPPGTIARGVGNAVSDAAGAAAAHLAAVRAAMGQLMADLSMNAFSSWRVLYDEIFTALEREAFIALFGSPNPVVLEGMVAGVPAQFIRYMTPNGEWAVIYNTAMPLPGGGSNGHPRWIPLIKGNTPFGQINSQGFLEIPEIQLNNTPGDIFVRPNPTSTTPGGKPSGGGGNVGGGGGLGTQPGSPM